MDYPTLDRIREVSDESQVIGAFIDWLRLSGGQITFPRAIQEPVKCVFCGGKGKGCGVCYGAGAVVESVDHPYDYPIEELLALYFEIDLKKASEERDLVYRRLVESSRTSESDGPEGPDRADTPSV